MLAGAPFPREARRDLDSMQDRLHKAHACALTLVLASLALVRGLWWRGWRHSVHISPPAHLSQASNLDPVSFERSTSCLAPTTTGDQAGVRVAQNIDYLNLSQGGMCLDVYRPAGSGLHPAVVLLHGEGLGRLAGLDGREALRPLALQLAQRGFVAVDVDWPPYPAYHFPTSVQGADAALRYVESRSSTFGVKAGDVGLLGTSAGGLVAGYVATQHLPYLKAAVTWSGAFEATGSVATPARLQAIFGCSSCPSSLLSKYSAVQHVTSTPPFALFNPSDELVPLSQPHAMAAALSAAGVPHRVVIYPGSQHALAYAAQAAGPTIQWFEKYLG